MNQLKNLVREEEGANLVEYALFVTFIAIVVIVGVTLVGVQLNNWYNALGGTIGTWVTSAST